MTELDIEQVLGQVRPKTVTVQVCLRGDLLAQHDALEQALAEARRRDQSENEHDQAPHIARQLQELEEELDRAATSFTFTAVGQRLWSDLITKHPPSEEDEKRLYEFDPRTFPIVAVAASCTSPKMTVEQAEKLYAALNFGQWEQLWQGCLAANVEGTSVPFSAAASVVLRGFESKSDSAGTSELRAVSSSGE